MEAKPPFKIMINKRKKCYITTAMDYIKNYWYNIFDGKEKIYFFQGEVKKSLS